MKWSLPILLVLCLAGAALADEVLLNSGDSVDGEILAVDEKGIEVKVGEKTYTLEPSELDTHDYYTKWAKRVPNDAKSHLRLAVFAYENGMFNQARKHYRKAESLDKDVVQQFELEVIPKIKEGVAAGLLTKARQAIKQEEWDDAKRILSKILTQLEDTKAAEEAREALGSVHVAQLSADQSRLLKSLTRYLPKDEAEAIKMKERLAKKLEPIQKRMKSAEDLMTKALRTNSQNRQKGIFEQAAKRFEGIVKDLDTLAQEATQDEALIAQVQEMRDMAVRDGVHAYVSAGQVYLIRGAFENAMTAANHALALDPDSAEAKKFQTQTIQGSNTRGGFWGRGRRR